ncbi:hypothetical protein JCM17380_24830 [Desulfosporosinus burensis]
MAMLDFIPINRTASIYRQTGEVDDWGQPVLTMTYTGKCQINYNTDLTTISGLDGVTTAMSATILFRGKVLIADGDFVEFTTAMGVTDRYQVGDVFFLEDWAGKIIGTRVVVGNGKRS